MRSAEDLDSHAPQHDRLSVDAGVSLPRSSVGDRRSMVSAPCIPYDFELSLAFGVRGKGV